MLEDFKHWKHLEYVWLLTATLAIVIVSVLQKDTLISTFVALCGIICVILIAKGKLSNYYYGALNTALYGFLAFRASFYANGLLYMAYFTPLNIYGIFAWKKHLTNNEVQVRHLTVRQMVLTASLIMFSVVLLTFTLSYFQDTMPIKDSIATVLGVVAMVLMIMLYAEQWILWIILNVFTINL